MKQTLILIRGIPGSGKTTLARNISFARTGVFHFENDQFFVDRSGKYLYRPEQIKAAVSWCLTKTEKALASGYTVIVSNTFTQRWEMDEYFKLADRFNIPLQIIETWGPWKDTHDVPPEKIKQMTDRFTPTKQILNHDKD